METTRILTAVLSLVTVIAMCLTACRKSEAPAPSPPVNQSTESGAVSQTPVPTSSGPNLRVVLTGLVVFDNRREQLRAWMPDVTFPGVTKVPTPDVRHIPFVRYKKSDMETSPKGEQCLEEENAGICWAQIPENAKLSFNFATVEAVTKPPATLSEGIDSWIVSSDALDTPTSVRQPAPNKKAGYIATFISDRGCFFPVFNEDENRKPRARYWTFKESPKGDGKSSLCLAQGIAADVAFPLGAERVALMNGKEEFLAIGFQNSSRVEIMIGNATLKDITMEKDSGKREHGEPQLGDVDPHFKHNYKILNWSSAAYDVYEPYAGGPCRPDSGTCLGGNAVKGGENYPEMVRGSNCPPLRLK
jgi:hypothetical protein